MSRHGTPSAKLPSPDHGLRLGGKELPDEALQVVGAGNHRELPVGFPQSSIAQMKAHTTFDFREGMLHPATYGTELSVPFLLRRRKRMSSGRPLHHAVKFSFLAEPFLLLFVDVGRILEDGFLFSIEHLVFVDAVVILSGGGEDLLDELPFGIGRHVPFVAVVGAVVFLRERSLRVPCGRPIFSLPSLGNFTDRGIDALATGDDDAVCPELPLHFHEERFVPSLHNEDLPKPADRRLVGNVGIGGDSEEILVRGTVMDVLLRLRIAEPEELLQERDAEEDVCIEWAASTLGGMEFCMPLLREREIDVRIHTFEECLYPCDFRLAQGKICEGERGCVRLHGKKGNGSNAPGILPWIPPFFASESQKHVAQSAKLTLIFLQRFLYYKGSGILVRNFLESQGIRITKHEERFRLFYCSMETHMTHELLNKIICYQWIAGIETCSVLHYPQDRGTRRS